MSSPCKKVRLSPRPHTITSSSPKITSQDSRVTSTPKRSTENVATPSISTISSSGSRTSRKRLSDVFESQEHNTSCDLSYEYRSEENTQLSGSSTLVSKPETLDTLIEDYDAYFVSLRIKHTGAIWELYKPVSEETLYAKIMENPCDTQDIVTELFLLYTLQPQKTVLSILKFYLDVAGFQNFDISTYNFSVNAAKALVDSLARFETPETLQQTGRYLLSETRGGLAKTLKIAVYHFINKLILTAHDKGVLYEEVFSRNVCNFLKCMSSSNLIAVRHTGVVIGMKMLTALLITQSKINQELQTLMDDTNNSDDSSISQKREQIHAFDSLVEYFYFIFIKNYHVRESKMVDMRVECIRELQIWIKLSPKVFISQFDAVKFLLKMVIDTSKEVRLAALQACEGFLKSPEIVKYLKPIKHTFVDTIGKRFWDADHKVAVKAIDIFTEMLKWRKMFITANRIKTIVHLVFDAIFPIGAAACRFLMARYEKCAPEAFLENLGKICLERENCITQCVVEGFLYMCPEIQDWPLYCKILLQKPNNRLNLKEAIADIFSDAVNQTLTGKSSVMRVMSRKVVDIDSIEHQKIAKCFNSLNKLLQAYSDQPNILISLLKIFPLVNTNMLTGNFCEEYSQLSNTFKILFNNHTDEVLLNKIAEALFHFCDVADFAERATRITDELGTQHTEELNNYSQHARVKTCLAAKKVSILYSHQNLNNKFTWEVLSENCSDSREKTAVFLLKCCAWYLVWNLRSLTDFSSKPKPKELPGLFSLHNRTCTEFTDICFNMLERLQDEPLQFKVYECLCDFYIIYSRELKPQIKLNKQFEEVSLIIDDVSKQNIMINFVNKHVLFNNAVSLTERRQQVVSFVGLSQVGVLSLEVLANISKLYYVKFDEYGYIIDHTLKLLSENPEENAILLLVIHTLATCYEDILKKHQAVDINTKDGKDLQLLVHQFLKYEYFRSPKRSLRNLTYLSIKYALKTDANYAFLYYAKYFVNLIPDGTDLKKVQQYFNKCIPQGADKNDAVLYFANYLKTSIAVATGKNKRMQSSTQKLDKSKREPTKRGAPKKTDTPSKKKGATTSTPKGKGKKKITPEVAIDEDDMSIQDSDNDDEIDKSLLNLRL